MQRFSCAVLFGCALLVASPALAGPVQIDFNVAGFGPADQSQQVFAKLLPGLPGLTFESLDQDLAPQGHLYWDADDGNGFADGFGVRDFPGRLTTTGYPAPGQTYSQDEVDGSERLRLTFSYPIQLLSFDVTDLFYENEESQTGLPWCLLPGQPGCYLERGAYSIDGGLTWIGFQASPTQIRDMTNGILTVPVNQVATSLILRASGAITVEDLAYPQLNDYSLSGVQFEEPAPVPEPSSLLLLGSALGGYALRRLSRRSRPASHPAERDLRDRATRGPRGSARL